MAKRRSVLWIIMFIIVIMAPSASFVLLKDYVDAENYENRNKIERPKLSFGNFDTFPEEFEKYYNDNLPYRNQLVMLNNSIDYFGFKQSSSDKVVIGKDGWLFYSSKSDYNPLEQSLGYWKYTEEQLKAITDNLIVTKRALERRGIEFVLFIAPNKETIYPEKLPDYYEFQDEESSTEQLIKYLRENTDIRIVYPYKELIKAKEERPDLILYRKTDTHWNKAGAYIGAVSLAEELGVTMPGIDEVSFSQVCPLKGDLANMLNIPEEEGEIDYNIDYLSEYHTTKEETSAGYLFYTKGADQRDLFVKRDSFSTAMAPCIATQFENSVFIRSEYFKQRYISEYNPDIFVLETVERYLPVLEEFRVSCIDVSVIQKDTESEIHIKPAFSEERVLYVTLEKVGREEKLIQELEPLEEEKLFYGKEGDTGEIKISVYDDPNGNELLEERIIQY